MTVDQATLDAVIASLTAGNTPPKPHCLANCGTPLDPMMVTDPATGAGWHLGCEPVPQPTPAAPPADLFTAPPAVQAKYEAARAEAIANYPAHVIEAGGPDHYAATMAQILHDAILGADWDTVRQIANDPYAAGDDRDAAHGALAGACQPVLVEPPSTVAELRQVLIDYDASRPRSMQKRLGPSELGTPCQQQMARKLAGAPRRPVDAPTWAPFQGTAVHAEMENVVAFWNAQLGRTRWLAEDDLEVDPGLPDVDGICGHGDAFDLDHGMVVDWKHVGTTALNKLRTAKRMGKPPAEQVSAEYRVQAHLYGLGHERKGRDVRHVRLVLLARSWQYDDSEEWTEAYDPDIAYLAIDRYYATVQLLLDLNVAANPAFIAAVPATPSADSCKWCPFNRPGQATGWDGCAGDTAAHARRMDRFTDGLIAP